MQTIVKIKAADLEPGSNIRAGGGWIVRSVEPAGPGMVTLHLQRQQATHEWTLAAGTLLGVRRWVSDPM